MALYKLACPEYYRLQYWRKIVFSAVCFFLLAGCVTKRKNYDVPALELPKQYAKAPVVVDPLVVDILKLKNTPNHLSATSTAPAPSLTPASSSPLNAVLAEWWHLLGSHELDGLMDRALANNPDLRIAALRIAQSKARLNQAGANKLPTITMPVQTNNIYPQYGIGRGNPDGINRSWTTHQISIRGDWRPDIWGMPIHCMKPPRCSCCAQLTSATISREMWLPMWSPITWNTCRSMTV